MHGLVGVELGDHPEQVVLGGVGRQVPVRRGEAQLGGLPLLDPDVAGAGVVVADQDGGEAGLHAALARAGGAGGDVGQDGLGHGCAGQQAGGARVVVVSPWA